MGKFKFSAGKVSLLALLVSIGAILGLLGVAMFKQPIASFVFASGYDCNQNKSTTWTHDGNDDAVTVDFSNNDHTVTITPKSGYILVSVGIDYTGSDASDFSPSVGDGTQVVTYTNSDHDIDHVYITAKMVCGKVNICHKDGQSGNFSALRIDTHAGIWQGGHSGHPSDFLYNGPVNADSQPTDNNWCTNNQPGDQCSNIDGKQDSIPPGKVRGDGNTCIDPPPVDVCPNDPGVQTDPSQCTPPPLNCGTNQYESGGECVDKTPVCGNDAFDNYGGADHIFNQETEIANNDLCANNQTEPTPTPTPAPYDACPNLEGIQTSIPDGYHVDEPGGTCNTYQFGGPPQSGGTGGGQVQGVSTTQGQVLGASTMGGTGTFEENLFLAIMGIGGTLSIFSIKNLKKAFKKA